MSRSDSGIAIVGNQQLSRQALGHARSGGGDAARRHKIRRVFDRQVHLFVIMAIRLGAVERGVMASKWAAEPPR